MLPADWVLLDIATLNAWRRPITVSITAGEDNLGWLRSHARLEGLHWRIVPAATPPIDREAARANLIDRRSYRGYADTSMHLEDVTRTMGLQTYVAARTLLDADKAAGELDRCRIGLMRLQAKIPLARLEPPADFRSDVEAACERR